MLSEAYRDFKYLLNRGYRKTYALDFVANHYRLTLRERHLLARCVFSDGWIKEVERKLLKSSDLRGRILAIDGFNVLITLESLMEGRAMLCEDGLVRDLKYQGKYRINEKTEKLILKTAEALMRLNVGRAVFFYGKGNPKSGLVAAMTRKALKKVGVPGEVYLVRSPDHELRGFENVATADTAVIAKVSGAFDLAKHVGKTLEGTPLSFCEILSKLRSPH
ncbi:DUF434 domain-containing protein [Thermococcus sp.]|uniref:DUF434 domain-containing protein n=1 Tax=Thermococcus sp. TaxID=35749 RepID=UPI0026082C3B|nr:DUF434 domain-containing protein [Thermococcus sp.]